MSELPVKVKTFAYALSIELLSSPVRVVVVLVPEVVVPLSEDVFDQLLVVPEVVVLPFLLPVKSSNQEVSDPLVVSVTPSFLMKTSTTGLVIFFL